MQKNLPYLHSDDSVDEEEHCNQQANIGQCLKYIYHLVWKIQLLTINLDNKVLVIIIKPIRVA